VIVPNAQIMRLAPDCVMLIVMLPVAMSQVASFTTSYMKPVIKKGFPAFAVDKFMIVPEPLTTSWLLKI